MSDTPYADQVITRLCAVCNRQKPSAVCWPQFGGVGHWNACEECIDAYHERRERPEAVLGKLGKQKRLTLYEEDE